MGRLIEDLNLKNKISVFRDRAEAYMKWYDVGDWE